MTHLLWERGCGIISEEHTACDLSPEDVGDIYLRNMKELLSLQRSHIIEEGVNKILFFTFTINFSYLNKVQ